MSVRARRGLLHAALSAATIAATLTLGFLGTARAQLTNAPVDIQIFRSAMDSKGFITLNSSAVLGQWDTSFGLVTTYSRKPLQLSGPMVGGQATGFSVDNVESVRVAESPYGIHLLGKLRIPALPALIKRPEIAPTLRRP